MHLDKLILQFRTITPLLLVIYIIAFVIYFSLLYIGHLQGLPFGRLTRDPMYNVNPLIGIFSNTGVFFFFATAIICFYSSIAQKKLMNSELSQFLFYCGLLTLLLMLDDFFMLHEIQLPKYLDISDKFVYLFYILFFILVLIRFNQLILETEYIILFVACFLLAMSLVSEKVVSLSDVHYEYVIEDGFKFFGIITWHIYFSRLCFIHNYFNSEQKS